MNAALDHAYRALGLQPGVSPLAARRRYRELVKEWHPDRYSAGSPSQAEATRRTQEINAAYRTLTEAGRRGEVPLRPRRRRVISAAGGVILGLLIARSIFGWVSPVVRVFGIVGAVWGWRPLEAVFRRLWWF